MRTHLPLIAALATMVAAPLAAGPFDGIYRPDYAWAEGWDCQSVGQDGGALAVQGDVFTGVENQCLLTNPVPVTGMDAILYDAQCAGEGESYSYRIMLMRLPEGIAVIQDGSVSELRTCR
jgi:hypothetical protein